MVAVSEFTVATFSSALVGVNVQAQPLDRLPPPHTPLALAPGEAQRLFGAQLKEYQSLSDALRQAQSALCPSRIVCHAQTHQFIGRDRPFPVLVAIERAMALKEVLVWAAAYLRWQAVTYFHSTAMSMLEDRFELWIAHPSPAGRLSGEACAVLRRAKSWFGLASLHDACAERHIFVVARSWL